MNPHANVDSQASPAAHMSAPPSPPLQRGKACISCRRRKMKCDGLRPVCTPCLRGERIEDCEYTDGQRRSRVLTLEEDVARLRARVQELENPGEAIPSVELYAPYASASSSSTSLSSASHAQAQVRTPAPTSHYHTGSTRQVQSHGSSRGGTTDPHRTDFEVQAHARNALSVIAPYTAELGFFLDIERLRVQGTHVLPALQSALTLWSVHITSTSEPNYAQAVEHTQTLASNLLSQAQTQFACALSTVDAEPDPSVSLHVIQTGVLLAYYMQRIGQVVGARYYASGTWALCVTLKLHRNPYLPVGAGQGECQSLRGGRMREGSASVCAFSFVGCAKLPPAMDEIEAEERVRAFWAVYALDRWFSALGHEPCQSLENGNAVTVPWPDVGDMDEARNVVHYLLNDPNHDFIRDGPSAMHAQASVLLGEAMSVAASYVADHAISQSPAFRARFGTLDTLLRRCLNAAMTVATGPQSQRREQSQALVTAHIIAFAYVTLHRPFISTPYRPPPTRCAEVAFGVVRILDRMGERGVGVGRLSPIYAIVWTTLCLTLHDEVLQIRTRPNADPSLRRVEGEMVAAIRRLVSMVSALSQGSPSRFFAIKIEAVLHILESIAV